MLNWIYEFRLPKSRTCRKIDFEDEEERKIQEGAETLLNLAGISTLKRPSSQSYEDAKRLRIESSDDYGKPVHFRPRLLRKKMKKTTVNNNTVHTDDEWVKHRRELEITESR